MITRDTCILTPDLQWRALVWIKVVLRGVALIMSTHISSVLLLEPDYVHLARVLLRHRRHYYLLYLLAITRHRCVNVAEKVSVLRQMMRRQPRPSQRSSRHKNSSRRRLRQQRLPRITYPTLLPTLPKLRTHRFLPLLPQNSYSNILRLTLLLPCFRLRHEKLRLLLHLLLLEFLVRHHGGCGSEAGRRGD